MAYQWRVNIYLASRLEAIILIGRGGQRYKLLQRRSKRAVTFF
jgi:hypothetical protein